MDAESGMKLDPRSVDEKSLELAEYFLSEAKWTEKDRLNLAHAIQQTVQEFIQIFAPPPDTK